MLLDVIAHLEDWYAAGDVTQIEKRFWAESDWGESSGCSWVNIDARTHLPVYNPKPFIYYKQRKCAVRYVRTRTRSPVCALDIGHT